MCPTGAPSAIASSPVQALACAGAGFLLAVLWFDLMHDAQVLRPAADAGPDVAVRSIARYYRRVTTDAFPMNRLVVVAMVVTLGGVVAELAATDTPAWVGWVSLALAGIPISVAALRTVRDAKRLGADSEIDAFTPDHVTLARSIGRDHVVCFCLIAALLVVQVAWAG